MARKANPIPLVGRYDLDAYCDQIGCVAMQETFGCNPGECKSQLRKLGWKVHVDQTTTCPRH